MATFDQVRRRLAGTVRAAPVAPSGALHAERAGRVRVHQILHAQQPQAKLTVGPPGDAYEREADHVADAVMRMPDDVVQGGQIQRVCAECEEELHRVPAEDSELEDNEMRRESAGPDSAPLVGPAVESGIQSLRGAGQPLPVSERAFFERRFGQDFGNVRIHADARAANLARSVNARAFTLGQAIAFGEGEYAPGSSPGRRLLAHELTHVLQQGGGGVGTIQRQGAPNAGAPAPCAVAPIAPIADADALAMEGGTRVIWNHTAANLQTCANNLVGLIQGAGGAAGITSAYRPQAYQDHLREVWDKARALQGHPEAACNTVRGAVNAEMANHALDVNRPVAQISNHRAGNAVDISWTLPATLTHAICQLPVPTGTSPPPPTDEQCIDSLAAQAGISHPLHGGDRPHFEV